MCITRWNSSRKEKKYIFRVTALNITSQTNKLILLIKNQRIVVRIVPLSHETLIINLISRRSVTDILSLLPSTSDLSTRRSAEREKLNYATRTCYTPFFTVSRITRHEITPVVKLTSSISRIHNDRIHNFSPRPPLCNPARNNRGHVAPPRGKDGDNFRVNFRMFKSLDAARARGRRILFSISLCHCLMLHPRFLFTPNGWKGGGGHSYRGARARDPG